MQTFVRKFFKTLWCCVTISLQIITSLLLSCILGPIFLIAWLINEITRGVISFVLYIRFGSKIHLVTGGADNIWNYQRQGNNRICFMVAICDQPINLEVHRKHFETRVLEHKTEKGTKPYEKLRKIFIQKYGYNCFLQDENFNIRNHVNEYSANKKGIVTERELLSKILPNLSLDMDESKPQWEEILIPQCQLKNEKDIKTVRVFRYHHGFMDGASALMMWANCMTEEGQENFPYSVNPLKPLKISKHIILLGYFYCFLMAALTIVKSFHIGRAAKNRYTTEKYSGQRHFGWSSKIDVSSLKKIGSFTKVSIPTILATSMASALRQMEKKFPKTSSKDKIPKEFLIGLVSAILPYQDINPRNRFTVTHFNLPTGDMSWYQRLRMSNKEIRKLYWEPALYLNFFMFKFFGRFPISVLQNIMENAGNPISFSNVPMTNRKISLWDNPTTECAGWAPLLTNTGLAVITLRYANHMRFCCAADDACLSAEQLEFFLSEVATEIEFMSNECNKPIPHINSLADSKLANHV